MRSSVAVDDAIRDLKASGFSIRGIKNVLSCGQDRITRAVATPRGQSVTQKRGRRSKLTPEIMRSIEQWTLQDGRLSNLRIAIRIEETFGVKMSTTLVWQARQLLRFRYRPPMRIQALTAGQIRDRVSFCEAILRRDLPPIVFSDESRFCEGPDNRWCYIRRGEWGESVFSGATKFSKGLMFFGAISEKFKSKLIACSGGVGAEEYVENVLKCGIIEEMNREYGERQWLFMQDGAPAHTAASSMRRLERHFVFLGGWPANSCDLNPIEMIWAIIKNRLTSGAHQGLPLAERIIRLWDEVPQSTVAELVRSFGKRCQMCLNAGGKSVSQFLSSHKTPPVCSAPDPMFTEEDDTQILELYAQHERKWTVIANILEERGRSVTAQDVKRRYRFLTEIENMDKRLAMPVLPGIEHFPFPSSLS